VQLLRDALQRVRSEIEREFLESGHRHLLAEQEAGAPTSVQRTRFGACPRKQLRSKAMLKGTKWSAGGVTMPSDGEENLPCTAGPAAKNEYCSASLFLSVLCSSIIIITRRHTKESLRVLRSLQGALLSGDPRTSSRRRRQRRPRSSIAPCPC
jgi:hypothetical protein